MPSGFQAFGSAEGYVGSVGDPSAPIAALSLTGWYRDYPTFTGTEPWVGSASAGASGGRTLYHGASSPTSGSFLNTHQTATFDGSFNSDNSQEGSGEHLNLYISVSAWSIWFLCNASAASAPSGSGVRFDPAIVDDAGGTFWQINYNTNGYILSVVDSGGVKSVPSSGGSAAPINEWHLIRAYGDGVNIGMSIDSAAFSTVACGAINNALTGQYLRLGDNFAGAHWGGQIADCGISNTSLSVDNWAAVLHYCNVRYGLSL